MGVSNEPVPIDHVGVETIPRVAGKWSTDEASRSHLKRSVSTWRETDGKVGFALELAEEPSGWNEVAYVLMYEADSVVGKPDGPGNHDRTRTKIERAHSYQMIQATGGRPATLLESLPRHEMPPR